MHDLVRRERLGPVTRARSVGPPGGEGPRWAAAAAGDGRRLAALLALLLLGALGAIKAFAAEPWSTPLTPILLAAPYALALGLGALATGARQRALPALVPGQGPSLRQIAGMACAACGGKIVVESEGALCGLCDVPCHRPCARGHRAEHQRLEAPHPYR